MPSEPSTESSLPSSAASKFADAVRELIRDELGHPEHLQEPSRPAWMQVTWVTIVVVNVVLLVGEVPEAALKNTSFEFA